jgi:predicted lipid-binding transport protein (Tim44 family)
MAFARAYIRRKIFGWPPSRLQTGAHLKNDPFDLTTLLFLVVAVIVFLRLRSVLGRKTGEERPPRVPPAILRDAKPASERDNVVPMNPGTGWPPQRRPADDVESRLQGVTLEGKASDAVRDVARADPSFKASEFLEGAKAAYEMIVTAYANGDRETLRNLLSPDVYDSFSSVIAERENRGEKSEFSFVGFVSTDIVDGHMAGRMAHVTVRFVTDLVTAVRDRSGEVVEGDLKAVRQVTDIWTFSRDVSSTNPNWRLVATDAP